jgi:soluble lytic murein transglycosylase
MKRRWLCLVFTVVLVDALLGVWGYRRWREGRFDREILAAAHRYGVEPALVKAVIWRESRFNAGSRGHAEELGLMQIREAAAHEWSEAERIAGFQFEHLLDPGTNTLAGSWYLAKLLKRYPLTDNPAAYALADYNAGRSHVLRWNNGAAATNSAAFVSQITFPGTRKYIGAVQQRREHYRAAGFGNEK